MKRFWYDCINLLLYSSVVFLYSACDLIEYHPYDVRITGETGINKRNMERIEKRCMGKDTIRFAVLSDTQRWYDETEKAVKAINRRGDIDFVVHCGDLADFGLTKEFLWMRDILNNLKMPYVCLIGNHDCLGEGENVFNKVFGETNFAFTAGDHRILCLNTNAFEYDYSVAIPDFSFIRTQRELLDEEVKHTVVAMHAKPMTEQFNNNVALLFQEELRKFPDLQFCICGHDHNFSQDEIFGDGIIYYECGSAKQRAYLVFTLHGDTFEYEKVDY